MERYQTSNFLAWLNRDGRKPLVMRGARQVGKTWLVRDCARRAGLTLAEVNFERNPTFARYFQSNDPARIVRELSLALGLPIHPGSAILFLDEVQAAAEVLPKLRWFAEELPALPVVATGSLLDFALGEMAAGMPVGRVEYLHLEPMSFEEYLLAHGQQALREELLGWRPGGQLSLAGHDRATEWFGRYVMVGGMPAAVLADVHQTPGECRRVQQDLVAALRDDFAKYAPRIPRAVLDTMLLGVASSLGRKLVYAHLSEGLKSQQAKAALDLLAMARVCHIVRYTTASGLPLGGETKDTARKAILLDVGLLHPLQGTPAGEAFPAWTSLSAQVRDQLAQQLVGQELRRGLAQSGDPSDLYFWHREGGRAGEIDYLIQAANRPIPIEVKAGAAGAMKSLHQFMHDKQLSLAVRVDANAPSVQQVEVRTTQGDAVRYRLISVPHYLAWRLPEICEKESLAQ